MSGFLGRELRFRETPISENRAVDTRRPIARRNPRHLAAPLTERIRKRGTLFRAPHEPTELMTELTCSREGLIDNRRQLAV